MGRSSPENIIHASLFGDAHDRSTWNNCRIDSRVGVPAWFRFTWNAPRAAEPHPYLPSGGAEPADTARALTFHVEQEENASTRKSDLMEITEHGSRLSFHVKHSPSVAA